MKPGLFTRIATRIVLRDVGAIRRSLAAIADAGVVPHTPTPWQIALGELRMAHRLIFRSDTVGTCKSGDVVPTWRARLLARRPLRFPFLVRERAVAPLDLSGLRSTPDRIERHLLGAHHDANQFVYDLQLLSVHPGRLRALVDAARQAAHADDARSRWLRDLVVYEGYHRRLLTAAERAARGDFALPEDDANDPDVSLWAYLRWCAAQPDSLGGALRAAARGELTFAAVRPRPARAM